MAKYKSLQKYVGWCAISMVRTPSSMFSELSPNARKRILGRRLYVHGWIQTARAALAELDRMSRMHFADMDLPAALRQEYENTIAQSANRLRELPLKRQDIRDEELLWGRRRLLLAEKDEVINAFQHDIPNQETYHQLLADIDARRLRIESGEKPELPQA